MPDWVPTRDLELLQFCEQAGTLLTIAPASWGQTAPAIAELVDRTATFAAALENATNAQTRGKATVFAKSQARAALVEYLRPLIKQIQASPLVSDQMRVQLNVPIHKVEPTPAQPIDVEPAIKVERVDGRKVYVRITDGTGTNRAKLPQALGVYVFTATGTVMPTDPSAYTFQGGSGKTLEKIVVPGSDATTLFVCAQWYNSRGPGPGCDPIAINIAAAPAIPSAKPMKMAA